MPAKPADGPDTAVSVSPGGTGGAAETASAKAMAALASRENRAVRIDPLLTRPFPALSYQA